eukprot:Lithocolla_globosa_v1_NODE_3176_length_1740_cov_8.779228.p1 type:complete len:309 gc:universal NODE_3176_length_1740_cov_8.779228:1029-103(-)
MEGLEKYSGVPAEYMLDLARQMPPAFMVPYVEAYHNWVEQTIISFSPETWSFIQKHLEENKSAHADKLALTNPFDALALAIFYLVFVVFLLPILMKPFDKFSLRLFSLFHNFFLVILSAYMWLEIIHQAFRGNYVLFGNGCDQSENGWSMARIIWVFYVSKAYEFIDTMIMALKKNNRQISFLHCYHHVTMLMIWWAIIYTAPGGEAYFSATLNSFIHVVMYSYYLFSSLGFGFVRFVKPYITSMQMFQFCLNLVQASYNIMVDIPYPYFLSRILFVYMLSLLALFGNFFLQNYMKSKEEKKSKKKTN